MAQSDVLQFMKRNRRWIQVKEIAEKTGISPGSINENMRRLRKQGIIDRKIITKTNQIFYYKLK